MPKLWDNSIATHRTAVRDSIMSATWDLVREHGLAGTSMSRIADHVGISRATLYRYFPDVDAIVAAWHAGQVGGHIAELREVADATTEPEERLAAVLSRYAEIRRDLPHSTELATLLHQGTHVEHAEQQVLDLLSEAISAAAEIGRVRDDVAPADLARFCLYALAAGGRSPGADLVPVVLAGLRR